jgi:hypothetical protein
MTNIPASPTQLPSAFSEREIGGSGTTSLALPEHRTPVLLTEDCYVRVTATGDQPSSSTEPFLFDAKLSGELMDVSEDGSGRLVLGARFRGMYMFAITTHVVGGEWVHPTEFRLIDDTTGRSWHSCSGGTFTPNDFLNILFLVQLDDLDKVRFEVTGPMVPVATFEATIDVFVPYRPVDLVQSRV